MVVNIAAVHEAGRCRAGARKRARRAGDAWAHVASNREGGRLRKLLLTTSRVGAIVGVGCSGGSLCGAVGLTEFILRRYLAHRRRRRLVRRPVVVKPRGRRSEELSLRDASVDDRHNPRAPLRRPPRRRVVRAGRAQWLRLALGAARGRLALVLAAEDGVLRWLQQKMVPNEL